MASDAAFLAARPLPTAPDGLYDYQVSADPQDKREGHSTVSNIITRVNLHQLFARIYLNLDS